MGISCKRNSRTEQVQRDKSCACNLFARHSFVPLLQEEKLKTGAPAIVICNYLRKTYNFI